MSRSQAIDEHDFYGGRYLAEEGGTAIKIVVEVVIADLDEEQCTKFRNNLEFWRSADKALLGQGAAAEAGAGAAKPAVRIRFEGAYDRENDEFTAKTWFAIPRQDDETPLSECRSKDKREFGFLPSPCIEDRYAGTFNGARISSRRDFEDVRSPDTNVGGSAQ